MNDPLELSGRVRRLVRPASGRVLIVGARRDSRRLARCLGQGPWAGLPVVGFIDAGHPRYSGGLGRGRHLAVHAQSDPVPVLGGVDRLDELVDRSRATHVVVAVSGTPAKRLRPRIAQLSNSDVAVHWVTEEDERVGALTIDGPPGARRPAWPLPWERLGKRLVDFVGAALGLAVLTPLFTVVAVAILITTGRPIFYAQERVGQGGRIFRMFKFRSMRRDAEGSTGPIWASDHDSRCTPVGSWLRRTNIDELPQLFNVLRGEMSLVGPRPERPVFVEQFRDTIPDYDLRHAVPGGMTGWAQVHGWRGRTSLRKRIQYDLDYIQRWSLGLDFRVLLMTVQHVAWGRTTWTGGFEARGEPFLSSRPTCSVVIPTYNGRKLLETCLASVAEHRPASVPIEVIVSDDGSNDDTAAWLEQTHPGTRLVRLDRNRGFCAAANAGIEAARGEFVQLLNNDTEVTPGWIEAGIAPFADPSVGSVAPLVLVRSDPARVDSAGDAYALVGWPSKRGHGQSTERWINHPADRVFGASGSSAFFRAEALRRVGGFDLAFGSYYEDVDLAFRLRWAGYGCAFAPACRILHEVSASYDHGRPELQRRMARNAEVLFWTDLPAAWLAAAIVPHLAFTLAQGAWRLARGRGVPFALGKWDALREVRTWPKRRRLRVDLARSGRSRPHFPIKLGLLDDARNHLSRPREASASAPGALQVPE